jgi:hypothetical protein
MLALVPIGEMKTGDSVFVIDMEKNLVRQAVFQFNCWPPSKRGGRFILFASSRNEQCGIRVWKLRDDR